MGGKSTKRLDLTGQRFGKLTAVERAADVGRRTAWRCRCDCGGEVVAKTVHLRAGKVTSCGCAKAARSADALRLHYIDGTCVEMLRKNPVRSNNRSGVTGVDWRKRSRRWRASICFKGTRYNLGEYEKFEDAVRARKEAEARTHGSFLATYDAACLASPAGGGESRAETLAVTAP